MKGPLSSLRVIEFCGLGPAPLAGQLLADMGAEVIVIDRPVNDQAEPEDMSRRDELHLDRKDLPERDIQAVRQ